MSVDPSQSLDERRARVVARLETLAPALPGPLADTAERVCVVSEFVLEVLERHTAALSARLAAPDGRAIVPDILDCSEADAMARLRQHRQVEMAAIAWFDIAGIAPLETCLARLSALADVMVHTALERAMHELAPRFGRPSVPDGRPAPLLVLGMGKLGGQELNFSSDIDLVFLYPDDVTFDTDREVEPETYYRRLSQALIRLLDQVTAAGFVFRVDVRLRPFGDSGPLAVSVSSFEAYLVRHGRDWERYAYVKARLITGNDFERDVFADVLTPFVYRRYLDYGMFDALRQMKLLIDREVSRKEMQNNIKLGAGGIREIEFTAQIFQIIRGGQDVRLRERRLLDVLPMLSEFGVLTQPEVDDLIDAYRFLRIVENRLQAMEDQQTHDLPDEPERQARLALAMNYDSWDALREQVSSRRAEVSRQFAEIAWLGTTADDDAQVESAEDAWELGDIDVMLASTPLAGFPALEDLFRRLREGGLYRRMDEPSRKRLAGVVGRLVPALEGRERPAEILGRVVPILEAIGRRSAYLALLIENPTALERLLDVAGGSPMLSQQLADHPALLDELIDPRLLDSPPSRAELRRSLEYSLNVASEHDAEHYVTAIRQFQRASVFRIATADRLGGLPLMNVSDRLTDTAELVLESALNLARRELEAVHGKPMNGTAGALTEAQFAIIAYGKLGGLELGYASDLDLVFIYDSSGDVQETIGPKSVDNQRFFVRLTQRLIHFLTIQTTSGRLYEIDTRLRPSGASGAMVASLPAFRRYQREQAWTWEHQALLRSRAVAGDRALCAAFEQERREVLVNHIDRDDLRGEIGRMRIRMRKELAASRRDEFDIKQDVGGLADIEFLIDYWVLAESHNHPELVTFPDNVRQLEALAEAGFVDARECEAIRDIYLAYRSRLHELALGDGSKVVADSEFTDERRLIANCWERVFGDIGTGDASGGG